MRKITFICTCLLAFPAFAEGLTDIQQAALTQITPNVAAQMPGAKGNVLAQCIVTVASQDELETLSQGFSSALVNDIMARSQTVQCFTSQ